MILNSSIKKSSFKYVHCGLGGLHSGEVMNMVCVDSTCTQRGMICPICRMEKHQSHQVLPIKTFLEHIRCLFTQSDDQGNGTNISDYLKLLQKTKKQIINTLKTEVNKLAQCFKTLQVKIEQNFASVRKNMLIQSSLTTKLPALLTLLNQQSSNKNPQLIQQQFKKYSQLLKYQNDRLIVCDKAHVLIENYRLVPEKLESILASNSAEFIKKLEGIPKIFQQTQAKTTKNQIKAGKFTFSNDSKYYDIMLQQENKLAKASEQCQQAGYVFAQPQQGQSSKKIVFQIVSNLSDAISIGLGNPIQFRNNCSFINDGLIQSRTDCYDYLYCNGAMKITAQDQTGLSTLLFTTGDLVEIQYCGNQIVYFNRTTNQKQVSKVFFDEKFKQNLQFVVGLCEGDSIRILNQ